jgi:hypothetical protein
MRGKQVVTAPSGERWQIGRRWLNRPPPKPWSGRRRRKRSYAIFTSGLFGRVVLRHPWTIEAVRLDEPKQRVRFAVKGWRRSRRAIRALAETIATTGPPSALPEATPVGADS